MVLGGFNQLMIPGDWGRAESQTFVPLPEGLNVGSLSAYGHPLCSWVLPIQVPPVVGSPALPGLPAACRNPPKVSKFS